MSPFFAKAQRSADSAWFLFDRGCGASDRAFFAMFNAARALLASRGLNAEGVRQHAKVRALLTLHFVETGRMESDLSNALRRADKVRRIAHLGREDIEPKVAREVIESMDRFMHCATTLLHRGEEGKP